MDDYNIIKLGIGILIVQVIIKILKRIFKQPRPKGNKKKTYGMPSSRSAMVFYFVMYLILSLTKKNILSVSILLLIAFTSSYVKYLMDEHSLNQLFVGAFIGSLIAVIMKRI